MYRFPFDKESVPQNGIYVLFESGEKYLEFDRIVYAGTHSGENNLCKRIKEHFYIENKNRSILRKNIGRAILNKNRDPFLEHWNIDLTSRKNKERYSKEIDSERLKEIEKEVSDILRKNFSFAVIPLESKNRKCCRDKLVATLINDKDFKSSVGWLGNFSPKEKIREGGIWLEKGLDSPEFTDEEMKFILQIKGNKIQ